MKTIKPCLMIKDGLTPSNLVTRIETLKKKNVFRVQMDTNAEDVVTVVIRVIRWEIFYHCNILRLNEPVLLVFALFVDILEFSYHIIQIK